MKTNYTVFKAFLALTLFFFGSTFLTAQNYILQCPDPDCGAPFGPVAGEYEETAVMENNQPTYQGPDGSAAYTIRLVNTVPNPININRWEVQVTGTGARVYFDAGQQGQFPLSATDNTWTAEQNSYNPVPSGAVLPVEFASFTGKADKSSIVLNWQTLTEHNNAGFEVQRSTDGREWEALDFVNGNDTAYELSDYSFADEKPFSGVNQYRLKQTDFDGGFEFSAVVTVRFSNESTVRIAPNPTASGFITLSLTDLRSDKAVAVIFDNFGRQVQTFAVNDLVTRQDVSELPVGVYLLHIEDGGQNFRERFVIE